MKTECYQIVPQGAIATKFTLEGSGWLLGKYFFPNAALGQAVEEVKYFYSLRSTIPDLD